MPLSSMTGFARASGSRSSLTWSWELKSVNGKALDLRLRLPPGFEALEAQARALLTSAFKRGSFQVNLAVQGAEQAERIAINMEVLEQYLGLADALRQRLGGPPPSAENLIGLRGVIEMKSQPRDEAEQAAIETDMLATLEEAAAALITSRKQEGAELARLVGAQLDQIEALHKAASDNPARKPEALKARLRQQVAELMEAGTFDEARLHQEAVLLATKADVREELDRLAMHVKAARTLLKSAEPVGRKFDFLAQEFNREANTLCSKANDPGLTATGLDLKTVIDQMREQVQNIE
ncbi:MAG: YicC family protein [Alphaproteobacteria bacterium]|nr:YicC family protein [Alphaproteobacteria bacterium]